LQNHLKNSFSKYFDYTLLLEKPKDKSLGHFATPLAFSLAKELRKSPMHIANEIAQTVSEDEMFESVEAVKGFINFKLSSSFLNSYASNILEEPLSFGKGEDKNEKILLEYVSANPTGPLHIGHARGAILGNALARIGKHLGYDIKSEYYVNDAGRQIDLLGLSIYLVAKESLNLEVVYPEEFYRGEYIKDLAQTAIEKFGENSFKDELSQEFQSQLSLFGKDLMLELIKDNLKSVGIEFDNFVSEKALYSRWEDTYSDLEKNSAIYEKDGKIWLKSSEFGDEKDRVVVRENKIPTYLAGDIIYHSDKFQRDFDKYINIWGSDHHGYIARVKASISLLGYDSEKLEVILSQMVALLKNKEPYKMSKRAGNFILMSDIVEEIGSNALKFIFLTKKSDTHLEFDVEDLKKNDSSNPVFYINYAYSRVNSLINKSSFNLDEIKSSTLDNLSQDAKDLLFSSMLLPEVLEEAFHSRQIQKVTDYLKLLASMLHKFYNENRVIDSEYEKETLKVLLVVSISIKQGLNLLGIDVMEKM
jgi:arginyl-tRNA synthetase